VPDQNHLSPEQLAALADGETPPAPEQVTAHLDGCTRCTAEVEAIRSTQQTLHTLPEPDLPPGLHARLLAAVDAELDGAGTTPHHDSGTTSGGATVTPLDGARARRRRSRQPLTWAAAAVALFAVIGVAGIIERSTGGTDGAGTAAQGTMSTPAAPEAAMGGSIGSGVPIFALPGEIDADRVQQALRDRPELRAALSAAKRSSASGLGRPQGTTTPPEATAESAAGATADAQDQSSRARSGPETPGLDRCLTLAGPDARAALLVTGTYKGRPTTILVTTRPGGGQAGLYVFDADTCTPLASAP
jgi:anti-sigma factor RsiW